MPQTEDSAPLRPWGDLGSDEQLELRMAYQSELDANPLTCSLEEKTARFTRWLAERGISFSADDLRRPRRS